jgi:BolA protein
MTGQDNLSAMRLAKIQQRLNTLEPLSCQIVDDSAAHAGHAGAASGAGHYHVTIVTQKFNGLKLIERHRLVYDAVGDLMQTDIHALVITALTPSQVP